jgi:glycosyltransferase involved in cell wall biosynthesis
MKIGLDAARLLLPTGEGTYTREVIRHLVRRYYREHEFLIVTPVIEESFNLANVEQYLYPQIDGIAQRFRYAVTIPRLLKNKQIEIFHNLTNYGLLNPPFKVVTTVHDLMTLKYPELRSSRVHWYLYKYVIPRLLKRADAIVTDSYNTTKDLQDIYKIERNVFTVHLGYNRKQFKHASEDDEKILSDKKIKSEYLLFVGYIVPKKNIELILHTLVVLRKKYNLKLKLVIAGKRGYGSEDLFHKVKDLSLENQINEIGYVPADDLRSIYRGAKIFLFPSKYEGFGLPALEAMACGTPALVSNAGSLPEIVGADEYICSAENPDEWAAKIFKMWNDTDYYHQASAWCSNQAEKFSWEKCAEDIMSVYKDLIEK